MYKNVFPLLFAIILFAGCDSGVSNNDPETARASLTFRTSYTQSASKNANITVEQAKLLVREITFHSTGADSLDFKTGSVVVSLNLDGEATTVATSDIPVGSYNKISFKIHKPEDGEQVGDSDFAIGTSGDERFSVIVSGQMDGEPFTFRSRKSTKQRIEFASPLVIDETTTEFEASLSVDVDQWFVGEDGEALDPTNFDDEDEIDDAIRRSIRENGIDL